MKNDEELTPPMTICQNCFETKREMIKGGVWVFCEHNKAGAYVPYHSFTSDKMWVTMSPMGVAEYTLWKTSFAAGLLGETMEENKKTTISHD